MASGDSNRNNKDSMSSFLKAMSGAMGQGDGGSRVNGPNFQKKDNESAKQQKRLADAFEDFAKQQSKFQAWQKDREENKDRSEKDWQQSMLDTMSSNTAKGKGDGKGGGGGLGGLLAGLGGLAASVLGPGGIIKAFKSLGHVIGTIYKGGKVFAKVMGKVGSILVDFTTAVGKATGNIGKFVGRLVSKTFSGAVNLGKRLLGFGGGEGAAGERMGGSFLKRAGSFFKNPASLMKEAGAFKTLGKIGNIAKGAGGGIARTIVSKGAGKAIPIVGTALSAVDLASQMHSEWKQKEDTHGVGWGGIANGAMSGGTIGATVGSIIPGVGTAIGGAVGAAIGGGTSAILQHKNAIMKSLKKPIKALKDTFKTITDFMQHLWNGSKVAWDKLIYPKLKAFGHVIETMWTKAEPILTKVGGVINKIGGVMSKVIGTIFNSVGGIVKKVVSFIGPGLKWIAKKVGIPIDDIEAIASAFNAPLVSSANAADTTQQGDGSGGSSGSGDGSPPPDSSTPTPSSSGDAPPPTDTSAGGGGGGGGGDSMPSPPQPVSASGGGGGGGGGFGGGGMGTSTGSGMPSASNAPSAGGGGAGTGIGGDEDLGPFDENRVMATIANAESGGHAGAKNPYGSATGLFQIVAPTLAGVDRVYHQNFTMADLKDPYKSVQAEQFLLYDQRRALHGDEKNDPLRIAVMHAVGPGPYNKYFRGRSVNEGLASLKAIGDKLNFDAANYEVSHMRAGYRNANGAAIQALKDGKEPPRRQDGSIVFMGSGGSVSRSGSGSNSGGPGSAMSGGGFGGGGGSSSSSRSAPAASTGGGGFGGGGTSSASASMSAPASGGGGGGGGAPSSGGGGGGGPSGSNAVVASLDKQTQTMKDHHAQAMQAANNRQGDNRSFDWDKIPVSVAPHDIQSLLAKRV